MEGRDDRVDLFHPDDRRIDIILPVDRMIALDVDEMIIV